MRNRIFPLYNHTKNPNDIESLILKAASMLVILHFAVSFEQGKQTYQYDGSPISIQYLEYIPFFIAESKVSIVPRAPLRIHVRTNGMEKYRLFANTRKADIINELIDEANAIIHGLITVIKCHAEIQSKKTHKISASKLGLYKE